MVEVDLGTLMALKQLLPTPQQVVSNRSLESLRFLEQRFGEWPVPCGSILYAGRRCQGLVELLEAGGHLYNKQLIFQRKNARTRDRSEC